MIAATTRALGLRLSADYNGPTSRRPTLKVGLVAVVTQFGAEVKRGQRWFLEPGIHFMVRTCR